MGIDYELVFFFECPYKEGQKVTCPPEGITDDEGNQSYWKGFATVKSVTVDESDARKLIRCKIVHSWTNH